MLLCHLNVRWTARCGHKWLTLLNLLGKLLSLALGGNHRTLRNLNNITKAYRLDSTINLLGRSVVLCQKCRCNHSHNLLATTYRLQNVKYLRNLKDSTKRTAIQALTAVDALALVNVLNTILVFGNRAHRTSLLAWYWNVHNGVIWTVVVTLSAADTHRLVNASLAGLWVKLNSALWTRRRT